MGSPTPKTRAPPPIWLMGMGFIPLGVNGTILLITVPQLLAANHVPEAQIATITSIGLAPSFGYFLFSPLLDWRFSRRAYTIVFTLIGAACGFGSLLAIHDLRLLTVLLFIATLAISFSVAAVGGWFGNLVDTDKKAGLGAWLTVGNLREFWRGGGDRHGAAAGSPLHARRGDSLALGALAPAALPDPSLPASRPASSQRKSPRFRQGCDGAAKKALGALDLAAVSASRRLLRPDQHPWRHGPRLPYVRSHGRLFGRRRLGHRRGGGQPLDAPI